MTFEQIFSIAEEYDISLCMYSEKDKVCGYEMEAYTPNGVNMIHFMDFRDHENITPEALLDEIIRVARDFDVDEEVLTHMKDPRFREAFDLITAWADFMAYKNLLKYFVDTLQDEEAY